MTNLILPKLKASTDIRPPETKGVWTSLESTAFQNVATSLDYQASGEIKSVSSVPTMWARPLSIEMALHHKSYPIRREMIAQWQGMLAAIALAEVRRFPLTAQLVDLSRLRQNPFGKALHELLPNPVNVLYTLDGNNPWQEVYVFLWKNKPVGMSSPSTIVASSEEGNWEGLPWWDSETKSLKSPIAGNYLNESEKALLWRWLENLGNHLHDSSYRGKPRAIDAISGLINEFRDSLGSYPDQALSLSDNPQFFGVSLNRGVLNGINYPAKAEAQPSNVKLIASSGMAKVKDLLILDPKLAEAWGKSPQNIWIHQDQTLASLRLEDLRTGRIIWQDVRFIESKDLFLPELTFIDIEDALPGGYLPPETQPLVFNKRRITPLLPLNEILLEYFTPEDLIRSLNITLLNNNNGTFIRIELDLPLSGSNNRPQNYRIYKDYPLKEENALSDGVPILEVWPHFQAEGWQEYYGFYYDAGLGEDTFQVSFPQAREPHVFQHGRGNYQLTRLDKYPSHILCQSQNRQPYGLILLKTPSKIDLTGSWRVGVDFGTSFTNVYVNRKGTVEPLALESLHHKVTEADIETRIPVLFEYFIPENFIPLEKPLPLSSVLTTRGRTNCVEGRERVLFDGRIYIPDNSDRFGLNNDWMETDLKWDNFVPNRLFLGHLALHISALAVSKGIKEIQWSLSYPSAFSRSDRRRYIKNWEEITDKLNKTTGIKHLCPEQDNLDYFRTESLAVAQYFASQEKYDLVRSTCIDIGGGTSDISIWEKNKLVHQCSVRLAGRQLFSQFIEIKPNVLTKNTNFAHSSLYDLKGTGTKFYLKIDLLLRHQGEELLKQRIRSIDKDLELQGLIRLITLGMTGLYYYVGILLKVLHAEGKYSADEITPVYIGGNGSRLLNWLDNNGTFDRNSEINELFSYMLSRGSGFEDTEELTRLSQKPKDEVACGLVLSETDLEGLTKKQKDPLIAGEVCEINGDKIEYDSRLEWGDSIKDFKIPELAQLFTFLDEFNLGIQELELEGIKPMPQHRRGKGLETEYKAKLYRNTKRELEAMLLKEFKKSDAEDVRPDAPFILGLKALLRVLAIEWAGQ